MRSGPWKASASLDPEFIREKLKDTNAEVRVAAIRASETLYRDGDHSLVPDLLPFGKDRTITMWFCKLLGNREFFENGRTGQPSPARPSPLALRMA